MRNINIPFFKFNTIRFLRYIAILQYTIIIIPVSYTHLDVYKRQTLLKPRLSRVNIQAEKFIVQGLQ